jgi:putative ATPase
VCEAEKSNAVVNAFHEAQRDARTVRDDTIPPYLKDNSQASQEDKAQSRLYKYPHDYGGYVEQQYLPDSLKDKVYYTPTQNGYEKTVWEIRAKKGKKD